MVFSTPIFLFLFLPLFLGVYYLLPFRARSPLILVSSYIFYGWWRVDFLALFFGVTLLSYLAGLGIAQAQTKRTAKFYLTLGVTFDLAALGYFKYFNFGVDSLNAAFSSIGVPTFTAWAVVLPIGLSFYTFQAISYVVDVYRKDAPPARNFWDLSAFIALFPQLIAGPVLRYKDLADQFEERTHTLDKFSEGALRFMVGFCKKVLIADGVATLADRVFATSDPTAAAAWLGAIAYTVQLYFDFSGYSDMAIGLGLMMGFRFMENFNYPYVSRSITEFWTRWHISLSSWAPRLFVYSAGRQPPGREPHLRQLALGDAVRWALARRELDVCPLGCVARRLFGRGAVFRQTQAVAADSGLFKRA